MLTKEEFINYMNTLKEVMNSSSMLSDALKNFDSCPDFGGFSNFRAEDLIVSLLEKLMDDTKDDEYNISDISYFIYDLEWGSKWTPDSITDTSGNSIDISTIEKLYDYLKADIENKLDK